MTRARSPRGPAPIVVGRRRAALLATSALAAGCAGSPRGTAAQAQPAAVAGGASAAPRGVVLPLPMPCADRPGDISGLLLEGTGSPAGAVVVFGQTFRAGDLPRGAGLAARLAEGGRPLRAQLDVPTRHPDGSARFGVVSLLLPRPLGPGERLGIVLAAAAGSLQEPPLDLAAALDGREAVLEVASAHGPPEAWRADLLAPLRGGSGGGRAPWQSGPLAVQRRVSLEVPASAAGGVASLRLVADVAVRADGTLWVDAWLRNDAAMRPGGGTVAYTMRLALDGREALRAEAARHFQYTGWGRLVGGGRGARPAPPQPLPRPDAAYLAETGAVARYDLTTGVDQAVVARMAAAVAAPDWGTPLGARGITRAMPTTGARADIGPMTDPQAAWLVTGDPRAAAYALGQAEAAGAVPWHLWDPGGGADGRGGWMDVGRWRGFWSDPRGGAPPRGLLQAVAADTGWSPDQAHQPDLSFFPYVMTGRRAFLDGLLAQAAWNVVSVWPAVRTPPGAAGGPTEDAVLGHRRQVRSAAWALRQLDEAAWIVPDDDPHRDYLRSVAAGNWAWLRAQIPAWTALQGEAHGWIPGEYGTAGALPPWQQDYFASTAAAAARRGGEDARAVLAWMANFLVGRFRAEGRGLPRHDGAAYLLAIAPEGPGRQPPFRSWAEIGEATRTRGMSNGEGWAKSQGDYPRLAQQTLAQLADVLGSEEAREAHAWLVAADAPTARPALFARNPSLNIVPRGVRRVPAAARASGCAPPAAAVRG